MPSKSPKASAPIIVNNDEENPTPIEVIAEAIVAISQGIKKLRQGPLNDEALIMLIQNAAPNVGGRRYGTSTPISKKTIRAVLEGIESLETTYLKK